MLTGQKMKKGGERGIKVRGAGQGFAGEGYVLKALVEMSSAYC